VVSAAWCDPLWPLGCSVGGLWQIASHPVTEGANGQDAWMRPNRLKCGRQGARTVAVIKYGAVPLFIWTAGLDLLIDRAMMLVSVKRL